MTLACADHSRCVRQIDASSAFRPPPGILPSTRAHRFSPTRQSQCARLWSKMRAQHTEDVTPLPSAPRTHMAHSVGIACSIDLPHPRLPCALSGSPCLQTRPLARQGTAFDLLHNSGWTLSYPQKLKCATDIASAMQYLHSVDPPVIHRDLKSLNSLLQNEVRTQQDVPVVKARPGCRDVGRWHGAKLQDTPSRLQGFLAPRIADHVDHNREGSRTFAWKACGRHGAKLAHPPGTRRAQSKTRKHQQRVQRGNTGLSGHTNARIRRRLACAFQMGGHVAACSAHGE